MKVCVLYGGMSTEHDVSVKSGESIISNLDKNKYDIYSVYIDIDGNYYNGDKEKINNIIDYLKKMDVVFPVLHGKYGEDGTIQGLLELIKVPYVGCKVLASSVCMDKVYTKKLLDSSNIKVTKYLFIKKDNSKYICFDKLFNEEVLDNDELINRIDKYLSFPVFVKASKSGSSIGVYECNKDNIIENIESAFEYDDKVLIEEKIIGRELEVAVLGNNIIEISNIGEINNNSNFYSYESKYIDSVSTSICNDLNSNIINEIKNIAYKAYRICDLSGLSRIDFFLDKDNNVILNEINTLPGFTSISMYPKLMMDLGYSYSSLLDKLIDSAFK